MSIVLFHTRILPSNGRGYSLPEDKCKATCTSGTLHCAACIWPTYHINTAPNFMLVIHDKLAVVWAPVNAAPSSQGGHVLSRVPFNCEGWRVTELGTPWQWRVWVGNKGRHQKVDKKEDRFSQKMRWRGSDACATMLYNGNHASAKNAVKLYCAAKDCKHQKLLPHSQLEYIVKQLADNQNAVPLDVEDIKAGLAQERPLWGYFGSRTLLPVRFTPLKLCKQSLKLVNYGKTKTS